MGTYLRPREKLREEQLAHAVERQRRRALSLPLPDPPPPTILDHVWATVTRTNLRQPTCDQKQSLFFSKLPAEIRSLIYKEVIGHQKVHLFKYSDTVRGSFCRQHDFPPDTADHAARRRFYKSIQPLLTPSQLNCAGCTFLDQPVTCTSDYPDRPKWSSSKTPLPLLQTCRQIYTEAIPLLYSTPLFSTWDSSTTLTFLAATPPRRLHHISSFHLTWVLPYRRALSADQDAFAGLCHHWDRQSWTDLWPVVAAALPNLRALHVELRQSGHWTPGDWEVVVALIADGMRGVAVRGTARYEKAAAETGWQDDDGILPDKKWGEVRWEVNAATGWRVAWWDEWEV